MDAHIPELDGMEATRCNRRCAGQLP